MMRWGGTVVSSSALVVAAVACTAFDASDSGSSGTTADGGAGTEAGTGTDAVASSCGAVFSEGFETAAFPGWGSNGNTGLELDSSIKFGGGTSLRVSYDGTAAALPFLVRPLPTCHFVASAMVYVGAAGAGEVDYFGIFDKAGAQEGQGVILIHDASQPSNSLSIEAESSNQTVVDAPIPPKTWTKVSFDVDVTSRRFKAGVGDPPTVVAEGTLKSSWASSGAVFLKVGASWASDVTSPHLVYFDDVKVESAP